MKIEIKLVKKSFLFVDKINLTFENGFTEYELDDKPNNDVLKIVLLNSIFAKQLELKDNKIEELINSIHDKLLRKQYMNLFEKTDLYKKYKSSKNQVSNDILDLVEDINNNAIDEKKLISYLNNSVKELINKINNDDSISKDDLNFLVKYELENKNRSSVLKFLRSRLVK